MNQLIHSTSPYLLQHAHNPVNWFPYGEEAFAKAKAEHKLVVISIGYAACHWCHVMEKESFEDLEVAEMMNRYCVSIKVDREERPDVDRIYMDAVVLMTQQGGWPLNCLCLPDGRPIYGGTYFPKNSWLQILESVSQVFLQRNDYAIDYAANLTKALAEMSKIQKNEGAILFSQDDIATILTEMLQNRDKEWGGTYSERNKFPLPTNQKFLLHAFFYAKKYEFQPEIISSVAISLHTSLTRMALGGIFDHVGGGFARYSTDRFWHVPHFEKMLYDNAQLVSLYAQAYHAYPSLLYKNVVYKTIDFVQNELTSPEKGFYASLDADSEGVEGKFYVWKYAEILAAFEGTAWENATSDFCAYYQITEGGNWEGVNVLWAKKEGEIFGDMLQHLYEIRKKRIRPALDDKILTSWNALMLKALVEAALVFGEKDWLILAEENAEFIWQNLTDTSFHLYRNYKNGTKSIEAFLEDYAFLIEAYLTLFSANLQEKWLHRALQLWQHIETHFYDEKTGMFFYTQGNAMEIVRTYDTSDDVIPASCSSLAHSLFTLHQLTGESKYDAFAYQMLQNVADGVLHKSAWHTNWLMLVLKYIFPQYEIIVTGEKTQEFLTEIRRTFAPDCLYVGSLTKSDFPIFDNRFVENKTLIYVCHNQTCELPVEKVEDMRLKSE